MPIPLQVAASMQESIFFEADSLCDSVSFRTKTVFDPFTSYYHLRGANEDNFLKWNVFVMEELGMDNNSLFQEEE